MAYAIDIKNLDLSYGENKVLEDINLQIKANTKTAIVGANGAGKSTLIKAVIGFAKKDRGEIKVLGKDIELAKTDIAYVPQKDSVNWNFPISVMDVVLMGRYKKGKLFKKYSNEDKELAIKALEQIGMLDFKDRQIAYLSGGQKQRVFLARALAQDAELYILDEPLTGVDIKTEDIIASEFDRLKENGKTIVCVHHNIYSLTKYFDDIVVLNRNVKFHGPIHTDSVCRYIEQGFRG